MELTGRLITAMPLQSGTSARGDWQRQEFVIETTGQYPRKMVFTVFGEDKLRRFANDLQIGKEVTVNFDIDAHEWNGRYYNEIRAFDVRQSAGSQPYYQQPPQAPVQQTQAPAQQQVDENLPF